MCLKLLSLKKTFFKNKALDFLQFLNIRFDFLIKILHKLKKHLILLNLTVFIVYFKLNFLLIKRATHFLLLSSLIIPKYFFQFIRRSIRQPKLNQFFD